MKITDDTWVQLRPLIPPPSRIGRPRVDDRTCLEGIIYQAEHSCRWRDIPPSYGSYITIWRRARKWIQDGTIARIHERLTQLATQHHPQGDLHA
jgi:transposase